MTVMVATKTTNFPNKPMKSFPQHIASSLSWQSCNNFGKIPQTEKAKNPSTMKILAMLVVQSNTLPFKAGHPCSSRNPSFECWLNIKVIKLPNLLISLKVKIEKLERGDISSWVSTLLGSRALIFCINHPKLLPFESQLICTFQCIELVILFPN